MFITNVLKPNHYSDLRANEFRKDYSRLRMLSAFFPNAVMIALTATANYMDRVDIKQSLHMNNPVEITSNPDRSSMIFYSKILRGSDEQLSYEAVLRPVADQLFEDN